MSELPHSLPRRSASFTSDSVERPIAAEFSNSQGDCTTDVLCWFGLGAEGCDVPDWIPFLTADEVGFDHPKLTIDFATGDVFTSYPTESTVPDLRRIA